MKNSEFIINLFFWIFKTNYNFIFKNYNTIMNNFIFFCCVIIKMFDGKFITTLFALIIAVVAVCNFNTNKIKSYENFVNVSRTAVKMPEAVNANGISTTVPSFFKPVNFQQSLPSRSPGQVPYGSLQRLELNQKHLATNPVLHAQYVKEGYCNSDKQYTTPPSFERPSEESYDEVLKQIESNSDNDNEVTSTMPIATMEVLNQQGEEKDALVYDRYVFANRHNRNRAHGDHIRGDLPIAPCQPGWFRPSVNPAVDLHRGAMFVLGGQDNSTSVAMARLVNDTSGDNTSGGVSMATLQNSDGTQMLSTLNVNTFPSN